MLGTPALFATAYGNVGSSIYYALGVTAVFALGLTPIVFVIAGLIFAATALTYTEGTVRYPEAGGSSSFARHAFNELVSFGAAWAQMLNYIITIAISAFFVPHYLSIFWEPLRENPWDVVGGAIVIVLLVAINIVGVQEATGLNVFLAVVDFATQLLLVILGFVLIFSPSILVDNVHWGTAPTWGNFFDRDPGGDDRLHGNRDGLEPRRGGPRPAARHPALDPARRGRRLRDLLHAAADRALGAAVTKVGGEYETKLGLPPEQGGFANDPVLGLVKNLDLHGFALHSLEIYVGLLAATILLVATNAGVIGASRITYSMATYRQLPEVFRRLHPRFKTPWLAIVVFAGIASIAVILPGQTKFLGTMYSFGAMLSFTIAHAAVVALRVRYPDEELVYRARPNLRFRGIDWPLFALVGGLGTGIAFLVVVVQEETTRWVGLGWLALGLRGLRGLPPVGCPDPAAPDGAPTRDRAGPRGRVPDDPRPGAPHGGVGGGARRGRAPRQRASGADRDPARARGATRSNARLRDARSGGRCVRDPGRGASAARVLRGRPGCQPSRPGAQCGTGDRRRDLHAGTPSWSCSEPRAGRSEAASRSSAERSTSCCETVRRESR